MSGDPGIFSEAFVRDTIDEAANALAAAGFGITQFNWPSAGLTDLPDPDTPPDYVRIRASYDTADVRICAVSGTYNMIHPDPAVRRDGTRRCLGVIAHAPDLGTGVVTLCTGTRTTESMWRAHPDNTEPAAWHDLRETLDELLPAAAAAGVRLGIEPEPSNVVRDARRAAALLDELGADARHLAIILDAANLLDPTVPAEQESTLRWAFDHLGGQAAAVHAKDVFPDGTFGAPGTGVLDYGLVLDLYAQLADVPLVIQDTSEQDVPRVREFLRRAVS